MRYTLLALMLAPVAAKGQEFPLSFNGLLNHGDIVSYQASEQGYRLSIASKEAYEMHLRGAGEDDQAMIESEPDIAAVVKTALGQRRPPRKGYRYQSDRAGLRWSSSFRKVLFVGNDYVILSKVNSDKPHQAIRLEKILNIGWLDKQPSVYLSPSLQKLAAKDAKSTPAEDKYLSYAKRIIARYDDNKDDHLVSEEWAKMLMSPAPADVDGDGRISVTEYAQMLIDRTDRAKPK